MLAAPAVSRRMRRMMGARFLKRVSEGKPGRLFLARERVFRWMLAEYEASLAWALRHSGLMLIILVFTIILNGILYYFVPKGFFPQQDVGRMIGSIQADQGISFQAMRAKLSDFA